MTKPPTSFQWTIYLAVAAIIGGICFVLWLLSYVMTVLTEAAGIGL